MSKQKAILQQLPVGNCECCWPVIKGDWQTGFTRGQPTIGKWEGQFQVRITNPQTRQVDQIDVSESFRDDLVRYWML